MMCIPFNRLDLLFGLQRLKHLILSNNSINNVDTGWSADIKTIDLIDLSHNRLEVITPELVVSLGCAHAVDLTFNQIHAFDSGDGRPQWLSLNLARNKLKLVTTNTLPASRSLVTLNLSQNALVDIESGAFDKLIGLRTLDLSSNELQELALTLPDAVENVRLGNNSLRLWPLQHVPGNLTRLDVHGNELSEIFPGHDTVHNLKVSTG